MNFAIFWHTSRSYIRTLITIKFKENICLCTQHQFKLQGAIAAFQWGITNALYSVHRHNFNRYVAECDRNRQRRWNHRYQLGTGTIASTAFLFNIFGTSDTKEETPEDKLITIIKRSILCIQRAQYDKAEQMLHLALRMAQDIQSNNGITYVFDVMANLAMEREQFKKAEALFTDVMKRLLADGHYEDSPQMLHISSKIAHMAQQQGELDKAMQGFTWTLEKIENNVKKMPDNKEIKELQGLTKNWFGQLLIKQGKYADAKIYFQEALDCLIDIYGKVNEEAVTILNNLSVVCVNLEDIAEAKKYLLKALDLIKELKDSEQEGVLYANLGLIYLREGLMLQAKEACGYAWRVGKMQKNPDAVEQAEYCLNEIKACTSKK